MLTANAADSLLQLVCLGLTAFFRFRTINSILMGFGRGDALVSGIVHRVQVTTLIAPSPVMTSCIHLKLGVVLVS